MKPDTARYLRTIRELARFAAFKAANASPARRAEFKAVDRFIRRRLARQHK